MTSDKQLAANRANAQKSTGPRTAEGKQKSRFNASRHELTGQVVVLTEEQRPHFDRLKKGIVEEYAPVTENERGLIDLYAMYQWRLHRAASVEDNMFSLGLMEEIAGNIRIESPDAHQAIGNAKTFRDQAQAFNLLSIYTQRLLNQSQKVLKQFQEAREARLSREHYQLNTAEVLYHFHQMQSLPFDPRENGFDISGQQLRDYIRQGHTKTQAYRAANLGYNLKKYQKFYPPAAA